MLKLSKRKRRATEFVLNRPIQYLLAATGDPQQLKQEQLRDETCVFGAVIIRESRATAGTATLHWINVNKTDCAYPVQSNLLASTISVALNVEANSLVNFIVNKQVTIKECLIKLSLTLGTGML